MQVKLILPVGENYLYRMVELPFAPFVDLQVELAVSRDRSFWSLVVVTEVIWCAVESQFECECYCPMMQDDKDSAWYQSRGWVPLP